MSWFRQQQKEAMFISCWCKGSSESEAMWQIFSGEKYGVAVVSVYSDLEKVFNGKEWIMAPIKYLDYKTEGFHQGNYILPFFHKRKELEHEKEIRIIRWEGDQGPVGRRTDLTPEEVEKEYQEKLAKAKQLKETRGLGIDFDFQVETLIKKICVHPAASEWYYGVVAQIVEKFCSTLSNTIEWSTMRSRPIYS